MIVFKNVHQRVSEAEKSQIRCLWISENAIPDKKVIEERLGEVVFVVIDEDQGSIVGVSSARKTIVKALANKYLYEFRCFISSASRQPGLDAKLMKLTMEHLEEIAELDPQKPIGVFAILENEELLRHPMWGRARWPEVDMHLIGYTGKGLPVRVHYFRNARI